MRTVQLTDNFRYHQGLMGKGGKSRNLALKGIVVEIDDSEDEDENEDDG